MGHIWLKSDEGPQMTASAALGVLPEWNLADLYAAPDAPEFKADMDRGEADE